SVTNAEIRYLLAPVAQPDAFDFSSGPILTVNPPGILANDYPGLGSTNLVAVLVAGPTNGMLTLSSNGGFSYSEGPAFAGGDSFTYKVNDGFLDSLPATVAL